MCVPKIGAPKYVKELFTDTKEEIDSITITKGDLNNQLPVMDRSSQQKNQ